MTSEDIMLWEQLVERARLEFGGHFTVMKFTTNWRVGFGTPHEAHGYHHNDIEMEVGSTFAEAARKALDHPKHVDCITRMVESAK